MLAIFGLNGCATQRPSITAPPTTSTPPRADVPPDTLPPGYVKSYVVFGKRYYILGSSAGFRETGIASWYGPKFHGRPTANGETYDMHQMTAAHKSLPLPTYVRVSNPANNRSIVVRVNDRGPFVGERIIDLSHAAAQALDLIGPGTGLVEVVALTESAAGLPVPRMPPGQRNTGMRSTPATNTSAASATRAGNPGVFVQIGSFGSLNNASDVLHRVKLGPYATADEQQRVLAQIHAIGLTDARAVSR